MQTRASFLPYYNALGMRLFQTCQGTTGDGNVWVDVVSTVPCSESAEI